MEDLKNNGIRVISLEMERNIDLLHDVKSFFSILKLLRKEKWDVIHTHCAKAGFLGRIASKLAGIPSIHTAHGWYFDEPLPAIKKSFYIFLERFAALFGNAIVALTDAERREIIHKKIAPPEGVTTIYYGIDTACFRGDIDTTDLRKHYGFSPENKIVGMIARLVTQKSPLDFVRAAAKVSQAVPEARFIIFGEGPLRENVESLRKELGIEDKLILAQPSHEPGDINRFLNLLDISVLTSYYEGFPFVALESMYLRKPLVITEVRGTYEIIQNSKNGAIVPISDTDAMAQAIINLLKDEQKAREIGEAAHRTIEEHFTAGKMAENHEKLYMRILLKNNKGNHD